MIDIEMMYNRYWWDTCSFFTDNDFGFYEDRIADIDGHLVAMFLSHDDNGISVPMACMTGILSSVKRKYHCADIVKIFIDYENKDYY